MVEVSDKKAYSVQGIIANGKKMVSIRQMYKTKNDPNWKPGKQGVAINIEALPELVAAMRETLKSGDFMELEER